MKLANTKSIAKFLGTTMIALALTGCSAKKNILYIQNATPDQIEKTIGLKDITIEPADEIMIFVSCDDMEVAQKLSLMAGSRRPDFTNGGVSNYNSGTTVPYLVNSDGDINMPLIGAVHLAGLTRQQASKVIADKIVADKLAKPGTLNVTVQFSNLKFSAIGEVARVGSYNITQDRLTLLEALSMAGDLTIHGRRDAIWVIRELPNGDRETMKVDIRDTKFMESPAYYVQQNDVIYVEPDDVRAGQSTLNENTFKSVGFYTSLVSVAISLTTLIVTLSRR